MPQKVRIALDAMGGDHGAAMVVPGAELSLRRHPDIEFLLFGNRAAVEPVIGHMKHDHRMGRNHLAHAAGDAINAVLAAAGYNFRRILAWIRLLLAWIIYTLDVSKTLQPA